MEAKLIASLDADFGVDWLGHLKESIQKFNLFLQLIGRDKFKDTCLKWSNLIDLRESPGVGRIGICEPRCTKLF